MITKLRQRRMLKRLMRLQACFWLINEKYDDTRPFSVDRELISCEFLNALKESDKQLISDYAKIQAEIYEEYARAKNLGLFGMSHRDLPRFLCKLLKIKWENNHVSITKIQQPEGDQQGSDPDNSHSEKPAGA